MTMQAKVELDAELQPEEVATPEPEAERRPLDAAASGGSASAFYELAAAAAAAAPVHIPSQGGAEDTAVGKRPRVDDV